MRLILAIFAALVLAACNAAPVGTTANTAFSPRETMVAVGNSYGAVLAAADGAIVSGKLPAGVSMKIAASTQAATNAYHAATAEAMKCSRDQATGIVGDAPGLADGVHCNPSAAALLIGAAQSAIGSASGLMGAFGVNVPGVQ